MEKLKKEYNENLQRYYNGCNYLEQHPEQYSKYGKELLNIKNKLDNLLFRISQNETISQEDILNGFKEGR